MRFIAVIVGVLLLAGGGVLIVVADQQRVAALDAARSALAESSQQLAEVTDANRELGKTLISLRDTISEQETQLADTTGLLP